MRAEGDEASLFLPVAALQDTFHCSLEVVVPDGVRDPTQEGEGLDVAREERFLSLRRQAGDEGLFGVAQSHAEELHGDLLSGDDHLSFPKVDLGHLTGLVVQGNEDLGTHLPAALANVPAHGGFPTLKAVFSC